VLIHARPAVRLYPLGAGPRYLLVHARSRSFTLVRACPAVRLYARLRWFPPVCAFARSCSFALVLPFVCTHSVALVPACLCVRLCLFVLVWAPLSASNTQLVHTL
jgi:hypothetical protein